MSKKPASRLCRLCHRPISRPRLEVLPDTDLCVDCARKNPPPPIDPNSLDLSQASPITRNGFGPND